MENAFSVQIPCIKTATNKVIRISNTEELNTLLKSITIDELFNEFVNVQDFAQNYFICTYDFNIDTNKSFMKWYKKKSNRRVMVSD